MNWRCISSGNGSVHVRYNAIAYILQVLSPKLLMQLKSPAFRLSKGIDIGGLLGLLQ